MITVAARIKTPLDAVDKSLGLAPSRTSRSIPVQPVPPRDADEAPLIEDGVI